MTDQNEDNKSESIMDDAMALGINEGNIEEKQEATPEDNKSVKSIKSIKSNRSNKSNPSKAPINQDKGPKYVPARSYLDTSVVPLMTEALREVAKQRYFVIIRIDRKNQLSLLQTIS